MKKILLLILGLLMINSVYSQFEFGIKGGTTLGHMNLDIPLDFSNTPNYGLHLGAFFVVGENDTTRNFTNIRFQPEISFIQKGVRIDDDLSDNYMILKLNYLEIPILCRSDINWDPVNVYFTYGPYFAILLSNSYKTVGLDRYLLGLNNGTPDAGLMVSMGIEINRILVEIRGACGLVNVAGSSQDFYDDSRNNYINISIGYVIK